ncbi:MAG: hypothetical protein ACD_42C00062G0004 [uncultured bacterium]|nr:MAG: hypothetical protein ACD_42C00062G0004 [uncultured bacterium]OGT33962.1 MAG: hypothetical protein A3C44_07855 [Gammaproteobacteria bacterium RIFCSPHIGHO2_02_FULL_39_13]OGT49184.1 MAG: hypothetical protein A3E53_06885 [Gammaproteobacteria bacterium RIFCSPHIGHO2_12_FULL_39_24]
MRVIASFFIVLSVVFLSACALSPIQVPVESHYTITQWPIKTASKSFSNKSISSKTLLITTPIASPGYDSASMIYVLVPYQLKSFANHRWVAPPADLLLPLMANRMRATKYFRAVVTSPFPGSATYQLNTQLLTLQQEFLQPQSQVRLVMEATLINFATGRVIASRVFQAVIPVEENNPYSGVLATNQAASIVIKNMSAFVINNCVKQNHLQN